MTGRNLVSGIGKLYRQWWFAYAMLAPVAIVVGVLVLYPLAEGLILSFTDATAANSGDVRNPPSFQFVGLDNYLSVLSGAERSAVGESFWTVLGRTSLWTFVNVVFQFGIGLVLAVALNRTLRARNLYRVILLLPWALPIYITAPTWRFLFNETAGPINLLLSFLGVEPVSWLGRPGSALIAAIITNVWWGVPFMMLALLGGLQSIPSELYEAAEIDGASPWHRFRNVTLPLLQPVTSTVILLGTIWTFNAFVLIFLLTQGGPAGATQILVTFAYDAAFVEPARQFAVASTYGIIILSILILFTAMFQRRASDSPWA